MRDRFSFSPKFLGRLKNQLEITYARFSSGGGYDKDLSLYVKKDPRSKYGAWKTRTT